MIQDEPLYISNGAPEPVIVRLPDVGVRYDALSVITDVADEVPVGVGENAIEVGATVAAGGGGRIFTV